MESKVGYAAIMGLLNSGKSSLLNAILGLRFSIVSNKPQTTRKRILGILSEENYQIIFLDTPGILAPKYLLQTKMMEAVHQSTEDADVFVLILDLQSDSEGKLLFENNVVNKIISESKKPKILLLNKIDLCTEEHLKKMLTEFTNRGDFEEIIPISATLETNVSNVVEVIVSHLPEGPKLYPEDVLSDENERFFVSEIIREKILELYKEEIPYSVEVVIQEFKERENSKNYIYAEIFVEKESQRRIVIGKNGGALKKLGSSSRKNIEAFLQKEVFLELRVKIKDKWRNDEKSLKNFGYSKFSNH